MPGDVLPSTKINWNSHFILFWYCAEILELLTFAGKHSSSLIFSSEFFRNHLCPCPDINDKKSANMCDVDSFGGTYKAYRLAIAIELWAKPQAVSKWLGVKVPWTNNCLSTDIVVSLCNWSDFWICSMISWFTVFRVRLHFWRKNIWGSLCCTRKVVWHFGKSTRHTVSDNTAQLMCHAAKVQWWSFLNG